MIFIGTVNVGNIVAPDIWRQSPIAEKIVSNSTSSGGSTSNAEGSKHSTTIQEQVNSNNIRIRIRRIIIASDQKV
jgi:hypothetical protein